MRFQKFPRPINLLSCNRRSSRIGMPRRGAPTNFKISLFRTRVGDVILRKAPRREIPRKFTHPTSQFSPQMFSGPRNQRPIPCIYGAVSASCVSKWASSPYIKWVEITSAKLHETKFNLPSRLGPPMLSAPGT